ncbi:hypothetical protein [Pseudomonas phage vB_Pae-PA152]|nr:hypothetical protein [Pseudomonas phage vB_Pae-PA152]
MAAPEFKLVQQQSGKTLEQMLANYLENGWSVFGLPFEVQNLPTVMVGRGDITIIGGGSGGTGTPGKDGKDGVDGKSAYQIWLDQGNTGDEAAFVAALQGATGEPGAPGKDGKDGAKGADGAPGANGKDGTNGKDGAAGKSAYQIWLDAGNTGTEAQFLDSLKGAPGPTGPAGSSAIKPEKLAASVTTLTLAASHADKLLHAQAPGEFLVTLPPNLGTVAKPFTCLVVNSAGSTKIQVGSGAVLTSFADVGVQGVTIGLVNYGVDWVATGTSQPSLKP